MPMLRSRRFFLRGLVGSMVLLLSLTSAGRHPHSKDAIIVTADGWVLRQSDLDLLR